MCTPAYDTSTSKNARQVLAGVRRQCAALGVDLSPLSDDELYHVLYTAWWLAVLDNRDANAPQELARSLYMLRVRQTWEGAA